LNKINEKLESKIQSANLILDDAELKLTKLLAYLELISECNSSEMSLLFLREKLENQIKKLLQIKDKQKVTIKLTTFLKLRLSQFELTRDILITPKLVQDEIKKMLKFRLVTLSELSTANSESIIAHFNFDLGELLEEELNSEEEDILDLIYKKKAISIVELEILILQSLL